MLLLPMLARSTLSIQAMEAPGGRGQCQDAGFHCKRVSACPGLLGLRARPYHQGSVIRKRKGEERKRKWGEHKISKGILKNEDH